MQEIQHCITGENYPLRKLPNETELLFKIIIQIFLEMRENLNHTWFTVYLENLTRNNLLQDMS